MCAELCVQNYVCRTMCAELCVQNYVCRTTCAELRVQNYVCRTMCAELCVHDYVCRTICAELCVQNYVCGTICAELCVHNYVCRTMCTELCVRNYACGTMCAELCMCPLGGWRIQTRAAKCRVYSPWSKEFVRKCDKTARYTLRLQGNLLVVWRGSKRINIQRATSRENKEFWSGLCSCGIWRRTASEFINGYSALQDGVSKLRAAATTPRSSAICRKNETWTALLR